MSVDLYSDTGLLTKNCADSSEVFLPGTSDLDLFAELQLCVPYTLSWSQEVDEAEDISWAKKRIEYVQAFLQQHGQIVRQYVDYCREAQLKPDEPPLEAAYRIRKIMEDLLDEYDQEINRPVSSSPEHFSKISKLDQIYRTLLNLQTPACRTLSWSCQTYRASSIAQFFDGSRAKKDGVNYDRVQSSRVNQLEQHFMRVYGFDPDKVELLYAASGMGAYNILEKYLLAYVLKPGDKVLVTSTMYEEHQDWSFRGCAHLDVITEEHYEKQAIVDAIHRIQPKVVFIDPLKNRQDARVTDVVGVLESLADNWSSNELYVLIDDTMLPAAIDPFKITHKNELIKIFLWTSCTKYMQLGHDLMLAGIAVFPKSLSKQMKYVRQIQGSILSDTCAWSYPIYERDHLRSRMRRLTRNALVIAGVMNSSPEFREYFQPVFPALRDHPDHDISRRFPFIGGTLNLRLLPSVPNIRDALNDTLVEMVMSVIEQAQADGTSICWGESIGFCTPRIMAFLEMEWREPPFIRISAGDRSLAETLGVAHSITAGLIKYMQMNRHKFIFSSGESKLAAA